ncbi:MAG: efflux RND transporter periplasmic adaptor subunit [Steroidobacteraceae bacterium]
MNRKILAAALIAVLASGIALGYWLAKERAASGADTTADANGAQKGDRRILYWYDPMRPEVKFDKPGKSPFMDMELVPMYADEKQGAAVRVDPAVMQSLGIRLGKVEKVALESRLSAVGSVAFDERRLHVVQARVEGYVTRLYFKTPLEQVRRGQPLAEIQAPEWLAAQAEYLALLDAESERARSIRDAARERLVVLGVPETMIRRIEETRKTDATTTVFAPADGVVTELAVREGAAFMPGAPLFRINGLGTVWVNAEVPEAQVATIAGASVEARATGWPGITFKGRVAALLPEVDPETRTLPVRIVIENREQKLAPGMFVSLDFAGKKGEPQLVVPSEAVIVTGERSVVVVAREGGGFDVAEVTVGAEADGRTAILSGLAEGQSIVLSGQFLIDSEASLKSAVTRLETEAAPAQKQP